MRRGSWWAAIGLTAAALVGSALIYPQLPEQVPTHWNLRGEVDAYGSRAWAAFLMPAAMAAMLGVFALIPWLSPRGFEVGTFRGTYGTVVLLTTALMGYIHVAALYGAWSGGVSMGRAVVGGIMLFFALLGNVLGRVRRNFYVGVRTPWTLASDRVWADTHRLAAWLFVACGLAGMATVALGLPSPAALVALSPAIMVPIVYSFVHYKRLERSGQL